MLIFIRELQSFVPRLGSRKWVVTIGLVVFAFSSLGWAPLGWAQSHRAELKQAYQLYTNASFAEALAEVQTAKTSIELRRFDLIEIYKLEALIYYAMGKQRPFRKALAQLATLDCHLLASDKIPPDFTEAYRQQCAARKHPPELKLQRIVTAQGQQLIARVLHDPAGVIESMQVFARSSQKQPWRQIHAGTQLPLEAHQSVWAYAVAFGPGKVPLATAGSQRSPLELQPIRRDTQREEGLSWWPVAAAGAALAAGVMLAIFAADASSSHDTVVQTPTLVTR